VAIMIVGIVVGVCIVIVIIVLCCVAHKPANEKSELDPVDARYAPSPVGLSAHLAASSTGMVFQVPGKFSPSGRPLAMGTDGRTKSE
jgi:hypothetical protein